MHFRCSSRLCYRRVNAWYQRIVGNGYECKLTKNSLQTDLEFDEQLFGVVGILFVDILLLKIPWNWTSLGPIIPAVMLSVSMFFMPESPNWLMYKYGRSLRVVEALHQLRDPSSDINKELDELEELAKSRKEANSQGFSLNVLKRQDVYKPILIGICLNFFQQFSGMNALQFYMVDLFKDSGSSLEPAVAVIVVNTAMLLATLMGGLLIDRLGRKLLLMISGLCHTSCLGVLGYYYYKHRTDVDSIVITNSTTIAYNTSTAIPDVFFAPIAGTTHETSLIPVICLVIFVTGFSLGYGPVIWIIISEICSSQTVGLVISFCSFICWTFTFIVTKEFEDLTRVATKYGAYWIFGGISATSVLFALYLPETKGKSVEEIQKILYPKLYENKSIDKNNDYNKNQFPRSEVSVLWFELELLTLIIMLIFLTIIIYCLLS